MARTARGQRICSKMRVDMKLFALALALLCLPWPPLPISWAMRSGIPTLPSPWRSSAISSAPPARACTITRCPKSMREFVIPGKVYLIERYFPLQGHPYGMLSAEYVCAASRVGKFEQVSNILFATQPVWSANGQVEQTVDTRAHARRGQEGEGAAQRPQRARPDPARSREGKSVPVTRPPPSW